MNSENILCINSWKTNQSNGKIKRYYNLLANIYR